MSWLLFMDESGHDHKQMPYEVRGGVSLHAGRLWPFVQAMRRLERESFGVELATYKKELKGSKLLERRSFKWAGQPKDGSLFPDEARRKHCRSFLMKGVRAQKSGPGTAADQPTWQEFTAYGQANLAMARGVFRLLRDYEARLFAVAIPCGSVPPKPDPERLRRDHATLLLRYERFLRERDEYGLLVMDETDKDQDRRFVRRMQAHFLRDGWEARKDRRLVPTPLFVSSDMTPAVQAADLCIYCVNWGFRLADVGMTAAVRPEVAAEFGPLVGHLCFVPADCQKGGATSKGSIAYVADPGSR
jgi:hypothetical protein